MRITSTASLDKAKTKSVKNLISICQKFDKTQREPYLLNILNFDKEMPSFFLGYDDDKLVGFLSVYADTQDPEISIYIHPKYRRKNYASNIYKFFIKETQKYKLNSAKFQTESNFLKNNPRFVDALGLLIDNESETWMTRNRKLFNLKEENDYSVEVASKSFALKIAKLQSDIFSEDLEVSKNYVEEAISGDTGTLYMLLIKGEVIATCTIDRSSTYNYLYGLAVCREYQRHGIGTYFMKNLINKEIKKTDKSFQIAVEDNNIAAKELYKKLGFCFQTQVIYLKKGIYQDEI